MIPLPYLARFRAARLYLPLGTLFLGRLVPVDR